MIADVRSNLEEARKRIAGACQRADRSPQEITLIAVTKTVLPEVIDAAFHLGIRNFGENRVQEAESKAVLFRALQPRPTLHMIGHLQSNKVKTALKLFDLFHSIDSVKLAGIINRQAECKIPILLEVNVAGEASKSGFSTEEVGPALAVISQMANIHVCGLMTVAPIAAEPEQVRPVFHRLRELRDSYHLEHLSMGMTDDFEIAIEEGATMIRLGRSIFGERV